jgi:UDP-N-acetylmuramate--alanine ligase
MSSTPRVEPVPTPSLDLAQPGRFHVVGAGGPGMSAIALVLAEMGHRVSGSDIRDVPVLDRLRAAGIEVHVGHDRSHVEGCDAVTYSSAIPARNIELQAAQEAGIPTLHRSKMLAGICAAASAVGVAGAHGKTTTTSMLVMILSEAGLRPSYVVGGDMNDVGTGAHWSGGTWFVVEADESDRTFLELPLQGTIVTNIEPDFLENYGGTFGALVEAFHTYTARIAGSKVVCLDDPQSAALAVRLAAEGVEGVVTYGTHPDARYRVVDPVVDEGILRFAIVRDSSRLGEIGLPLRGLHNARNATAATAMAMELGAPFEACARALSRFGGVARRFDIRGLVDGITLVDDYGHLPTEIDAVLEAAATSGDGWKRIVAVFQPNRYSRVARLAGDYRDAFVRADLAVITDVYPSGEQPLPGITGKLIVDAVLDAHPFARVAWVPRRAELVEYLARELRPGDVCISMGCGDVAQLPSEVLARLSAGATA